MVVRRGRPLRISIGERSHAYRYQFAPATGNVSAMEADVREALRHLITAFENHLEAVASRRSPDDAVVDDAYEALAAAFERYEEQLDLEFAETLPVVLDDPDDEGDDVEFEYEEGDDGDDDEIEDDEIAVVTLDEDGDDAEIDDDIEEFNLRD